MFHEGTLIFQLIYHVKQAGSRAMVETFSGSDAQSEKMEQQFWRKRVIVQNIFFEIDWQLVKRGLGRCLSRHCLNLTDLHLTWAPAPGCSRTLAFTLVWKKGIKMLWSFVFFPLWLDCNFFFFTFKKNSWNLKCNFQLFCQINVWKSNCLLFVFGFPFMSQFEFEHCKYSYWGTEIKRFVKLWDVHCKISFINYMYTMPRIQYFIYWNQVISRSHNIKVICIASL